MDKSNQAPATIDEYIAEFPPEIRDRLQQMREAIRAAAPGAVECISYRMPAFRMGVVLVYFAAFRRHIGFYPTSNGIEAFRDELKDFAFSKGAIQFPHDKPLPLDLVGRITRFRVAECGGE